MRVISFSKKRLLRIFILAMLIIFTSQQALTQELASIKLHNLPLKPDCNEKNIKLCYNNPEFSNLIPGRGVTHRKVTRWLSGRPAIVNIITVNPDMENLIIKPSYGSYRLNSVRKVKDLVAVENAVAGINASYFKPDTGVPLGTSIVNGEVLTGPLYQRVVLGVTEDNNFKMNKIDVSGEINIGTDIKLSLFNINQPVFSKTGFTIYTDRWGTKTPHTSQYYCHIVVLNNQIQYIKQSKVSIPQGGYVVVGPRSKIPKNIKQFDNVNYTVKINPENWNDVKYAVGGGPYLIKEGKVFIDRQHFSERFLWMKAPRTAVGYTKTGNLLLITIDGRQEGTSGATLPEVAKLMQELGAFNAMNLDGGSSTQMVYKGKVVNRPTVRGGNRVTNALVIIPQS